MALIKCPHCGKSISDKAKTCIHCGTNMYEEELLNDFENELEMEAVNDMDKEEKDVSTDVEQNVNEDISKLKNEATSIKTDGDKKTKKRHIIIATAIIVVLLAMIPVILAIVKANTIDHIEAAYMGSKQAGILIDENNDDIVVKAVYKNGKAEYVDDWIISNPKKLVAGEELSFTIGYKDVCDRIYIKAYHDVCQYDSSCKNSVSGGDEYCSEHECLTPTCNKVKINNTRFCSYHSLLDYSDAEDIPDFGAISGIDNDKEAADGLKSAVSGGYMPIYVYYMDKDNQFIPAYEELLLASGFKAEERKGAMDATYINEDYSIISSFSECTKPEKGEMIFLLMIVPK